MTNAQHHAAVGVAAPRQADPNWKGPAPQGMWWVAWRQHRAAILTATAVMAALAAALVLFRMHLITAFGDLGCSTTTPADCLGMSLSELENQWRVMHGVMIAAPIVLGVFAGAPIFAQDFGRGNHVIALTQSVRRTRWWVTKLAVAGVPLLAGLVGLGYLTVWMDHSNWMTHRGGMSDGKFQAQSIMPAVFGLVAFAVAVTAGILLRSVIGSLVSALLVASALVLLIAFPLRPHLLPTTRQATPIEQVQAMIPSDSEPAPAVGPNEPGAWFIDEGMLDTHGHALSYRDGPFCDVPPPAGVGNQGADSDAVTAYNKAIAQCFRDQGIVAQYIDYLPASRLWPMRLAETGISVLLAALALALGAWRLKPAIAKR